MRRIQYIVNRIYIYIYIYIIIYYVLKRPKTHKCTEKVQDSPPIGSDYPTECTKLKNNIFVNQYYSRRKILANIHINKYSRAQAQALSCIGLHWFCIGLHWFTLVCIGLHWFALVLHWFTLVCIGLHWFALVCIGLHWGCPTHCQ
jgi:hypothetical protein